MSRTVLLLLLSLAACAPLDTVDNQRQHAEGSTERADLLGSTVTFSTGFDLGEETATDDRELFAQVRGEGCGQIAVYSKASLDTGSRRPDQLLDCPEHLAERGASFFESLEVRDDLLLAGAFLYRRTGDGWRFEAELGAGSPVVGEGGVLLGDGQAGVFADGHLHIYEHQDGRWREVQRLPSGWGTPTRVQASGGLLYTMASENRLYGRRADGSWTEIDNRDNNKVWLHNGHLMDTGGQLWAWDGTALARTGLRNPTQDVYFFVGSSRDKATTFRAFLLDERFTMLTSNATRVYDLDGNLLAVDDETPLRMHSYGSTGLRSVAHWVDGPPSDDKLTWTHLQEPVLVSEDPDESFVQTHELTLQRGEQVRFEVDASIALDSLSFQLSGDGDADLYVKFAEAPTPGDFDCAPYLAGSEEVCLHSPSATLWDLVDEDGSPPGRGVWHVLVEGFAPISSVTLVVRGDDASRD